jgi:hypothetical protein
MDGGFIRSFGTTRKNQPLDIREFENNRSGGFDGCWNLLRGLAISRFTARARENPKAA